MEGDEVDLFQTSKIWQIKHCSIT